jgi:hypothetical protein
MRWCNGFKNGTIGPNTRRSPPRSGASAGFGHDDDMDGVLAVSMPIGATLEFDLLDMTMLLCWSPIQASFA